MHCQLQPLDGESVSDGAFSKVRIGHLVWGFVALGIVIRLVRYFLRMPLMVDECMLAENFLDRGFFDLLAPLDHFQMAPPGFLWIELFLTKLLGFSEWSLRLFPALCGIGSLLLFRHFASRIVSGFPLVVAVACVAIAKGPVGLSTDAKPYASDLFLPLVLMTLAVEWLRRPDRIVWLWGLAAAAPLALAISFPAVFVAGAVSLALIVPLWRQNDRQAWCAWLAYNALVVGSFSMVLWLTSGPEFQSIREFMDSYWDASDAFPPRELGRLAAWWINVHLGDKIFSLPYATNNGGGIISFVCCAGGAGILYRRGLRPVLVMLAASLALTFVAAILRRYPYGGHVRLVQYLVPSVAVMCGLGVAALLGLVARPDLRRRLTAATVLTLALFGAGIFTYRLIRPYDTIYDEYHQEFSRQFWRDEPATITICALTDLGEDLSAHNWYPYYRCNQRIYSPSHHAGRRLPAGAIDRLEQPVRLVVYRPRNQELKAEALADCLKRFEPRFELAGRETHTLPVNEENSAVHGTYEVYRFVPREKIARAE
jgi:hypothetical protein